MDEWLPVVLGCIWGAVAATPWRRPHVSEPERRTRWWRITQRTVFIAGLLAIGTLATLVSGEAAQSSWFAAIDVSLAAGGALAGAAVRRRAPAAVRDWLARRAARPSG